MSPCLTRCRACLSVCLSAFLSVSTWLLLQFEERDDCMLKGLFSLLSCLHNLFFLLKVVYLCLSLSLYLTWYGALTVIPLVFSPHFQCVTILLYLCYVCVTIIDLKKERNLKKPIYLKIALRCCTSVLFIHIDEVPWLKVS